MPNFQQGWTGDPAVVLAQRMGFDVLKQMFWGRWAKFTTPGGVPVSDKMIPRVTESPVVIQNELSQGKSLIQIPVHRNLNQLPRVGNQQLKDHEERPKINHASVPIDVLRHAEMPYEGFFDQQITKQYNLLKNARPALLRYYARVSEYLQASYAMYYGFSYNVLNSSNWGSHSIVKKNSHPNCYVAGTGKVSGTPGTSTYETNIGTAVSNLGAANNFDTGFLRFLAVQPEIRKIAPIVTNEGNRLRLIVAHPYQLISLKNDSQFDNQVAAARAQAFAKDNPYLYGARYIWEGFAIFEAETVCWPVSVSGGKPVYGPSSFTDLDDFESKLLPSSAGAVAGFVLGINALFKAQSRLVNQFKTRVDDYGAILGIAYQTIEGYARGDFWNEDDGTRGEYLINRGSALFITYESPPST
ncbi:MAG: DUF4043 family protein [Calditrichaeota bacterium]|nr:DUF4043 family protein [Calditrichota bacterium]